MRSTTKTVAARSGRTRACARAAPQCTAAQTGGQAIGSQPHEPVLLNRRTCIVGSGCISAAALALTCAPQAPAQPTQPSAGYTSDNEAPRFFKTPSGVKIQEVTDGRGGPAAQLGDYVLFDYVLRRSNGYFIYATVEGVSFQPRDVPVAPVYFKLGDPQLIPGLNEVLVGMEPGSKRRALIPPSQGYTNLELQPQPPTYATKRQLLNHASEPLLFEVQLLKVNP